MKNVSCQAPAPRTLLNGIALIKTLNELYFTHCFRLSKLKILEARENHLKTLPKSMSRLTCLERLDIGNNDFSELVS